MRATTDNTYLARAIQPGDPFTNPTGTTCQRIRWRQRPGPRPLTWYAPRWQDTTQCACCSAPNRTLTLWREHSPDAIRGDRVFSLCQDCGPLRLPSGHRYPCRYSREEVKE